MSPEDVRQVVLDIIAEINPDEDLSAIDDEKTLREQIELDSMDFLDIVMELRRQHGVEVPEDDYGQLATMKSTVEYLLPKMQKG